MSDKLPVAYNIFLTIMFSSYEGKIISGLSNKGYSVSATSGGGLSVRSNKNSPCITMGIRVDNPDGIEKEKLFEDMISILEENKMKYYSMIVSRFSFHCMWNAGNIHLPKIDIPKLDEEEKKKAN